MSDIRTSWIEQALLAEAGPVKKRRLAVAWSRRGGQFVAILELNDLQQKVQSRGPTISEAITNLDAVLRDDAAQEMARNGGA